MTWSRLPYTAPFLATALLVASGCYTFRSSGSDRTVWEELPNDPRPELWIEGTPKVGIVFEGVYSALNDAEPWLDEQATGYYQKQLRRSRIFTEVHDGGRRAPEGLARVRMRRLVREDGNTGANLTKAATVPGLLVYRFGLEATLRLELEHPDGETSTYEARSVLTRIYHHSGNRDAARQLLYREADGANTKAILHQLRADADLFDPVELVEPAAPEAADSP